MFSFFKKKETCAAVTDIVWMSEGKKMQALALLAKEKPDTVFIAWFDESYEKLSRHFNENNLSTEKIFLVQQISRHLLQGLPPVFVEHYPLRGRENELYERLGLETVRIHSALDEPFLQTFGGERIISLMKHLGAKEDECFQHPMISSSIKNAQGKMKEDLGIEHLARSQEEWLRRNVLSH